MAGMKDAPILYRTLHAALPLIVNPYFQLHIEGQENVPAAGGAVLASNHLAFIDSVLLALNLERPVYFLGKADYFESAKTRWFFSGVGVIPTHRQGGDKARESLESGLSVVRRGDLLGIYPEGTRSPDGRLYRGKTGPARIAIEGGVPIVPCGIIGTRDAQPPDSYLPRRRPAKVRYGRPLDFSRYSGQEDDTAVLRSATDELMYEIMLLSGQEYVDEYAANIKSGQVMVEGVEGEHAPQVGEEPPGLATEGRREGGRGIWRRQAS
ncbi:MAG: 1-acyl-sn-glycerol-3-phosphate acyltransferase [Actinomycetota bacterium]|nr:1-acyl-sn-glycerol-3-phosphate acyltransferase [Actinomycetota bacterium]